MNNIIPKVKHLTVQTKDCSWTCKKVDLDNSLEILSKELSEKFGQIIIISGISAEQQWENVLYRLKEFGYKVIKSDGEKGG